ncbi:MAG: glutathionylspermidine synthase family protein [Dactylosporangium sp.]|nr:glutathionylspermidine synthase family protein [Dactylosporangium sp.]NNJ61350.1 glutathionylspermidine synthase family protein [Dactylosporangium sp.]
MLRRPCVPRPAWEETVRADGLVYVETTDPVTGHTFPYWSEDAYYEVSAADCDRLAEACDELAAMFIMAGDHIIEHQLFAKLGIPAYAVNAIVRTWADDDPHAYWPSIYGRFDLRWSSSPDLLRADPTLAVPKLLEYNADTPTAFPESTAVQWNWFLFNQGGRGDQWNNAYEAMTEAWKRNISLFEARTGRKVTTIHFAYTSAEESGEDGMNTTLIATTAQEAGYRVKVLAIEDVQLHATTGASAFLDPTTIAQVGYFFDPEGEPIEVMFKLYPWEWMFEEAFGRTALWNLAQPDGTLWIEPPYKALWSNKGILPILWDLFGDDPARSRYLLPAYFEGEQPSGFDRTCVRKPLLGREGANITIVVDGEVHTSKGGEYGAEGYVLQQYAPLPLFEGIGGPFRTVTGVWMIDQTPAGLCFRETPGERDGLITNNQSRFVPHLIKRQPWKDW